MSLLENKDNVKELVDGLNFKEKVDRSMTLIREAYEKYGDGLVVANSLGKDSGVVWDLAKKADPKICRRLQVFRLRDLHEDQSWRR
ncbi:hypothetical protein AUJ95_05300 [Candidatus Desantisbacteria bacterium CG2_30_40_21]|uniref:Phosphoadenosine phosphosulphate reductase domain-containing protein n=2 Tax=unclassified Candidatus Desantisiibacteriota TaxID=3106372 RepID=A0A2H0AAI8_9BACT|nr:MAG: hypothetical protein AUJ95_05300 [Candidatus Desantisbacteria bacterium CG2_30_40_21]PIP42403.1 MAG: hypothetical protein COX18_00450 [Candidatus Desantisbacteria bacterium CG23_combo_of_CG06-09_8_20_14_all_40_23]